MDIILTFFKLKKVQVIIHSIVCLVAFLPITSMSLMSFMAFDSPGSENEIKIWALVIFILLWPVNILLSLVLSWILYFMKKSKAFYFAMAFPYLHALLLVCTFTVLIYFE